MISRHKTRISSDVVPLYEVLKMNDKKSFYDIYVIIFYLKITEVFVIELRFYYFHMKVPKISLTELGDELYLL